jgi:hypothetical protein
MSLTLKAILCSCGVNFLINTSTLSPTLNLLNGLTFSSAISETGNKASKLELLSVIYPTCGYSAEKIYLYLATDYIQTKVSLDEDEIIITELIPLDKVLEMIDNGTIKDAKTICAITTYVIRYKK